MDLESIYKYLPVPLQNLSCNLLGWKVQRERYGGNYNSILHDYENRSFWSMEEITDYRNKRLNAFVQQAANSVPYYKNRFRKLGISPADIQKLEDLKHLPILSKDEVQSNTTQLLSGEVSQKDQIIHHTSGTTGGGLRFSTTLSAIQEQWAVWWRYRHWHGIHNNIWCGYFGGRSVVPLSQNKPPYWRYNFPGHQLLFSGYHMSPQNLDVYIQQLRRKRPPWLHGYPSLLALLASFIIDKNIDLGYQVKWITIGAESLLPQQIDLIEKAFGVRPLQHYGMAEAIANISECERGSLHVDEDFAAVEFIPNSDGPGYKIIGTNFSNPATPLIRYDVQDIVTLTEQSCPCGRPGRVVSTIDGRQEDYIILKNGARIGRMDHVFKDMVNIHEAQIYQQHPGEIIIRLVPGKLYSHDDESALLYETRKRVGDDTSIIINYMDNLPRSNTGKLRFVISEIEEGKIRNMQA